MVATDEPDIPAPSFLMARVKMAKERARSHIPAPAATPHSNVQEAASPEPTRSVVTERRVSPGAAGTGKKSAAEVVRDILTREADETFDTQAALALFETHAKDTAALELLRPALPALLDTIVAGAMVRGTQGFQDRMTLFRMMRVPWTPTMTDRSDAKQTDENFANRLVSALSRVEGGVRHARVTVDVAYDADMKEQLATIDGETVPSTSPGVRSRDR